MKTAAIITLYGNNNYGNKLQNYALQEILKYNGIYVETIINIPIYNNRKVDKKKAIIYELKNIFYFITKGDEKKYHLTHSASRERKKNFLNFNKFINNNNSIFSFKKIAKFDKYDYYFVGSDQVWNPEYGGLSDLFLLTFPGNNSKKISVSASFGIDKLPINLKEKTRKYLYKFDAISVREDNGKKIINELLPTKDVEILIDPTMMLDVDDWNKVSKKPSNVPHKKYILCYFLGGLSEKRKEIINLLANGNDLEIINLLDKNSIYNSSGPSEFLYLESHASIILTDSYHASIFAIIYRVPFVVFERDGKFIKMGSRIDTLLKKFGLEDRKYYYQYDLNKIYDIDFSNVDNILMKERNKFNTFIKKNI